METEIPGIKREVAKLRYVARTKSEFNQLISNFYTCQTGTDILLMMVVVSRPSTASSLENLEHFGALKAISAKNRELVYMILFMAPVTSLTGYGLDIGLVTLMLSIAHSHCRATPRSRPSGTSACRLAWWC